MIISQPSDHSTFINSWPKIVFVSWIRLRTFKRLKIYFFLNTVANGSVLLSPGWGRVTGFLNFKNVHNLSDRHFDVHETVLAVAQTRSNCIPIYLLISNKVTILTSPKKCPTPNLKCCQCNLCLQEMFSSCSINVQQLLCLEVNALPSSLRFLVK